MRTIMTVVSLVGLFLTSPLFATEADQDALIAQCTQEAKAAGVQEQEMDNFINNCLEEKIGYEKEK